MKPCDWVVVLLPAILIRGFVHYIQSGLPVFYKYVHLAGFLTESQTTPFHSSPVYTAWLHLIHNRLGVGIENIRWIQAIFGVLTLIFLVKTTSMIFGRRAGLLAGLVVGMCGPVLLYESDLVTTSLDVLIQTLCIWSIISLLNGKVSGCCSWFVPGIWMGLSVGLRPNMLPAALLIILLVMISTGKERRLFRYRFADAACFCLAMVFVVAPITLTNWIRTGEFIAVTGSGGAVLYSSNNYRATGLGYSPPPALTELENTWMRQNQVEKPVEHAIFKHLAERAVGRILSNKEASGFYRAEAMQYLFRDPLRSLRLWSRKLAYVLNMYEVLDTGSLVVGWENIHGKWPFLIPPGLILVTGLFGLTVISYRDRRVWVILAFILTHLVTGIVFYVNGRLRAPMIVCFSMFAGAGICSLAEVIRKRLPSVWLSLLAVMGIVSLVTSRDDIIRRHSKIETPAFLAETRGLGMLQQGRLDQAEQFFKQAAARHPLGAVEAWANLAFIYGYRGDAAKESIAKMRLKGLWTPEELQQMKRTGLLTDFDERMAAARYAWSQNDPEKAVELFRKVLKENPDYPDPWFNCAMIESRQKNPDWSMVANDCDRALANGMKLDLESSRAHDLKITAYGQLNQPDLARRSEIQRNWEAGLVFLP